MPPLCGSGYGLGTLAWPVAGGAALLFLTNLVAIVAVGTVAFVAAGFNGVDVVHLERDVLATGSDATFSRWLASRLSRVFESRFGPALRFAMPFMLLAAVYVPLRRALDEVAWEVRARNAVREALARETLDVGEAKAPLSVEDRELAKALDAMLLTQPGLTTVSGKTFELRLTRGACNGTETSPTRAEDSPAPGASGRGAE